MATTGFVILAHTNVHRVQQIARFLSHSGSPVVVHIDRKISVVAFNTIKQGLRDDPNIIFVEDRQRCEWGQWSLVKAQIISSQLLLDRFPKVDHVFQISGSCLPIHSIDKLNQFLNEQAVPTDFIESVALETHKWVKDGLSEERLIFYHFFKWRQQRRLFDLSVGLQRRFNMRRKLPYDLKPAFGSQWWCLTRATLTAIFEDPHFEAYCRFFKRTWIPDESFFQSLARKYTRRIESRSLTFSRFDFQGKPAVFYDDHLQAITSLDTFFVRKVWHGADKLYSHFLNTRRLKPRIKPLSGRTLQSQIALADSRRTTGRAGLISVSRYPLKHQKIETARPYSVYIGFCDLIENMPQLIETHRNQRGHGRLFHPKRVELSAKGVIAEHITIPDSTGFRDYAPAQFLSQLIWYSPEMPVSLQARIDEIDPIMYALRSDPNCHLHVLEGGWALAKKTVDAPETIAWRALIEGALLRHDYSGSQNGARLTTYRISDIYDRPEAFSKAMFGRHIGLKFRPNWPKFIEHLHDLQAQGINLGAANTDFLARCARNVLYPELALIPDAA